MSLAQRLYLIAWVAFLVGTLILTYARRSQIRLLSAAYLRWLSAPWRIVTGALGTFAITIIAPYTGDPTWDYVDAPLMASMTFVTAPFAVGVLARAVKRERRPSEIVVAVAAWFASASWSYDLYILLRDGIYPPSALANLGASSILYLAAGLFWSLEARADRGVTFAFLEADWLGAGASSRFGPILLYGVAFMTLVTGTMAYVFLGDGR